MRRRQAIALLAGTAAAWPLAVRSQQGERLRTVGILIGSADHAEARQRLEGFTQTFQQLGWTEGQNIRLDIRWGGDDPQIIAANARELVRLKPDVILVGPSNAVLHLKKETHTIPIVFVGVSDPLGQGIVQSIARPAGNITGFTNLEFSLMGKWLQILKEAAPSTTRVGLMISTANAASPSWYRMFNAAASALAIEPVNGPVKDRTGIEDIIKSIARKPNGAIIMSGDTLVSAPPVRQWIIGLTAAYQLPALSGDLAFAPGGGLISYGVDRVDPYRHAASYVDRILKGARPTDLPIQQPTKFHFAINLKTARTLGLTIPLTLQAAADEVIE
jgi:putative ABC transport system substrate-binding protein